MQPYDLEAPTKNLLTAMVQPHPCSVCGRDRPGFRPLTAGLSPGAREHAHTSCDRQVLRWHAEADRIREYDAGYLAAAEALEAAEVERSRVYLDAMLAAGLPEWLAKRRVEALED